MNAFLRAAMTRAEREREERILATPGAKLETHEGFGPSRTVREKRARRREAIRRRAVELGTERPELLFRERRKLAREEIDLERAVDESDIKAARLAETEAVGQCLARGLTWAESAGAMGLTLAEFETRWRWGRRAGLL